VSEDSYLTSTSGYSSRRRLDRSGTTFQTAEFIHVKDVGSSSIADGTFVRTPNQNVFRIAGGAPIYVTSWAPFGGSQPFVDISYDQFGVLQPYPKDGTQLVAAGNGTVYVTAGGAPIVTGACTIGGWQFCDHAIPVDPASISSLDHLRPWPTEGTQIASAQTSNVWTFAGGAPIQTRSCAINGWNFCDRAVHVDQSAIDALDHMRAYPADGTQIASAQTSRVWVMAGGAPIETQACTIGPWNFCDRAVHVDQTAVDNLDHLRAYPTDGTRLAGARTSNVWVIAGGAPIQTHACTIGAADFCSNAVHVDETAISGHDHLRSTPLNGTRLRYQPSGRVLQYVDGYCTNSAGAGGVDIDQLYAPCVEPSAPGQVSAPAVRVRGKKVTLSWAAPSTHGSPVTGFSIRSSKGLVRSVDGSVLRITLKMKPGRYTFVVAATSALGEGPASPGVRVKVKNHRHHH